MNIKKILEERQNKLSLHFFLQEKLLKNKQKQLKDKEKSKLKLQKFQIQKKNQKLKSIEGLFPKEMGNDEIKNKIDEIKRQVNKIKQKY